MLWLFDFRSLIIKKINAFKFSQKKIFFWEESSFRKIFFREDSLSRRFQFLWKRFQFLSRKFQFEIVIFALCKSKTEDIICRSLADLHEYFDYFRADFDFFQENFDFFREDFSNLLFAKAKLRACYAAASA